MTWLPRIAVTGVLLAAVLFLILWHEQAWWWAEVHTGTVHESGPYYGFWSGFGSDLGELAIVGGLLAIVRKHNCEVHRCWRLSRHTTAAGHGVCRVHHPEGHLTAQDVLDAHNDAKESPDG